jgi:hypothetical protein
MPFDAVSDRYLVTYADIISIAIDDECQRREIIDTSIVDRQISFAVQDSDSFSLSAKFDGQYEKRSAFDSIYTFGSLSAITGAHCVCALASRNTPVLAETSSKGSCIGFVTRCEAASSSSVRVSPAKSTHSAKTRSYYSAPNFFCASTIFFFVSTRSVIPATHSYHTATSSFATAARSHTRHHTRRDIKSIYIKTGVLDVHDPYCRNGITSNYQNPFSGKRTR